MFALREKGLRTERPVREGTGHVTSWSQGQTTFSMDAFVCSDAGLGHNQYGHTLKRVRCALVTSDWDQPRKVSRGQKGHREVLQQAECTGFQSPHWLPGLEAPLGSGQHRQHRCRDESVRGRLCLLREGKVTLLRLSRGQPGSAPLNSRSLFQTRDTVCLDIIYCGHTTLWDPHPSTPCCGSSSALLPWLPTLCPYTQVTRNVARQPGQW